MSDSNILLSMSNDFQRAVQWQAGMEVWEFSKNLLTSPGRADADEKARLSLYLHIGHLAIQSNSLSNQAISALNSSFPDALSSQKDDTAFDVMDQSDDFMEKFKWSDLSHVAAFMLAKQRLDEIDRITSHLHEASGAVKAPSEWKRISAETVDILKTTRLLCATLLPNGDGHVIALDLGAWGDFAGGGQAHRSLRRVVVDTQAERPVRFVFSPAP